MSYQSYVPARKAHIRKLIERQYLNILDDTDFYCECQRPERVLNKQGYNDSTITNNMRIAQIISSNLGGRITFGDASNINYLGGIEGQPGGLPRPLRNKF
jgi:hypothetical protein